MRTLFEPESRPSLRFGLKNNTMCINRAAMNAMGNKPYVQFLWDGSGRTLLIAGRATKERDCFAMERTNGKDENGIGREYIFQRKAFADAISLRMGWDTSKSYKVYGGYAPRIKMIVFRLDEAEMISDESISQGGEAHGREEGRERPGE